MIYTDKEVAAVAKAISRALNNGDHIYDAVKDALSAVPREPEGFRLVPVEPTEEWVDGEIERRYPAKTRCGVDLAMARAVITDDYRAMIAAAPKYGEGK